MAKVIMYSATVMLVAALAGLASSESSIAEPPYGPPRPYPPPPPPYGHPTYKQKGIPYSFSYAIKDDYVGADYGQAEKSNGELVQGTYYVALPDGRLQTVKYQADHVVGYVADVEYEGDAKHPPPYAPSVVYRPQYPAPTRSPYSTTAAPTEAPATVYPAEAEA
ncbi:cuticle protein 7-like [Macrobrachium rosenbergii]|uniref:cuticle protein 7-like n=1 Tax=Macrobrachium rosenbergii TaxID=79674 RepID=UPI0034D583F2